MVKIIAECQFPREEQLKEHIELPVGPIVDFEVSIMVEIGDATILWVSRNKNVLFASSRTIRTRKMGFQQSGMLQLIAELGAHSLDHWRSEAQF
jgi:hypothetical protein